MPKVLVYGWYHQGNIGDNLFVEAFTYLFPHFEFVFTESISLSKLENIDAVFFGGGSFLYGKPRITDEAFAEIKKKKIFYLGVGVESEIHPYHLELMKIAKMIATRSSDQVDRLKSINPNSIFLPDLVYSLQNRRIKSDKMSQHVLIMSNMAVVPSVSDLHWKHAAWSYFKSEFSQFVDWLILKDYTPHFFSMCQADQINDDWASQELIGHLEHRRKEYFLNKVPSNFREVTSLVSQYDVVVTQRFHGIVLSEITRTPYVAIHHHDKLKLCQPNDGQFLSYYNCSKHSFIEAFEKAISMQFTTSLPIESNIFERFIQEVVNLF